MKNIILNFLMIIPMIFVSSCGTASRVSNNPYSGEGYSESFDKNIAHDKAFLNAIEDVSKKYDIAVMGNYNQFYNSSSVSGRGKSNEDLTYNQEINASTSVNANDIVEKVKYTRKGNIWTCTVTVTVSPDNIH